MKIAAVKAGRMSPAPVPSAMGPRMAPPELMPRYPITQGTSTPSLMP